jgi:dimethylhistidine N-methyltransferase/ergothioneine biosynthesis protein EgtC
MTIHQLIAGPRHGLYEQSWAPREQRWGTVNADGFGAGWYPPGATTPVRYRRAGPVWADRAFADVARATRTGMLLAAVRSATDGCAGGAEAAAPFTDPAGGPWLFSHNGALPGWPAQVAPLAATLPVTTLLGLDARCDSAFVWALALHHLRAGAGPAAALTATCADLAAHVPGARLNLLLTDGERICATAWGDTLYVRRTPPGEPRGVLVASEPDDRPGWVRVPDRSLVTADTTGADIQPLGIALRAPRRPFGEGANMTELRHRDGEPRSIEIDRRLPDGFLDDALREDAAAGLTATPKTLPPKWFYDARGSALFEEITRLPEYYPTRAEREILTDQAVAVARALPAATLVELGSGSSEKTRLLIDALLAAGHLETYVPVDVSEAALLDAGRALREDYPDLDVTAVLSDFTHDPAVPRRPGPTLVAFLGGTIGNLDPGERAEFLARLRDRLAPGDGLLLGADLVKDPATLVAAYDDAAGVTAAFDKNLLAVLNRELGADFDPGLFDHLAVWNADTEWIEMRLRARRAHKVQVRELGLTVEFAAGEEMRTEISAKFRAAGLVAELARAGFDLGRWWTDHDRRFGLALALAA